MRITKITLFAAALAASVGLGVALRSFADAAEEAPAAGQPEFKLPPGWTMEDMQACIVAGTPGEQHERLARDIGKWRSKTKMWMTPDSEPVESEGTATVTEIMDGRYIKTEMEGEMPGMGPYHGGGVSGYDNVAQQFVSTWIDNHSTGIMKGTGELSDDGKTLTWTFEHNCPITKKPTTMREVETTTGPNTKTLEMFGKDPKSGKEYKMMQIDLTKE